MKLLQLAVAASLLALGNNAALASESVSPASVIADLSPETANEALAQIPDRGRKLLALRSYIRAGANLEDRWSWTKEEIAEFQGSAEQSALLKEVAAINKHFSQANPGYSLYANTRVRSLDLQIKRWNKNKSVGQAADFILAAWTDKFGNTAEDFADLDVKKARKWLARFSMKVRANLAAPGLTRHGQASAIDFQIRKGDALLADTSSGNIKAIWVGQGWADKLKASVDAAGPSFEGPLKRPYEPWHYNYEPASDG